MFRKILKILLVIIVIIFISLIINNLREANIIYRYSQKLDEYNNIKNFYIKYKEVDMIKESWRKDNIGVTKTIMNDNKMRLIYTNEDVIWILSEEENEKGEIVKRATKQKNKSGEEAFMPTVNYYSLYAENKWKSILMSLGIIITEEIVDGEECYKIYINDEFILYVNKESYMKKKEINCGNETTLLEYEFNCLSDEDLELLNFIGYEVKIVD